MFKTRLLSGILLVIIALATIVTGGDVLFATLLMISFIGMTEIYKVLERPAAAGWSWVLVPSFCVHWFP